MLRWEVLVADSSRTFIAFQIEPAQLTEAQPAQSVKSAMPGIWLGGRLAVSMTQIREASFKLVCPGLVFGTRVMMPQTFGLPH